MKIDLDSQGLKELPNYNSWRLEIRDTLDNLAPKDLLTYFASWGHLAPSAHNKQGWKVSLMDRKMIISPDSHALNSISDGHGRQAYISLGCFIENVISAIGAYGGAFNIQMGDIDNVLNAEIFIDKVGELSDRGILESMLSRSCYRGRFDTDYKLSDQFLSSISSFEFPNLNIKLTQDTSEKLAVSEIQAMADRAVILNWEFRKELSEHLVPSDSTEGRVMPADTFGLSLESGRRVQEALSQQQFDGDFAAGLANSDRDSISNSSGIGVIYASEDSAANWIHAGRLVERIWLSAEKEKLAMGILAAMIESPSHSSMLGSILNLSGKPLVFFKLGRATDTNWPHSPRVPVSEIISLTL
jgi:hypothetical protein